MNLEERTEKLLIANPVGPVADFNPRDEDRCYCGSGDIFGSCCGSTAAVRPPPRGLFLFENYWDAATTRELCGFAETRCGERLTVIDQQVSTTEKIVRVEDSRRVAERVDMGSRRSELSAMVRSAFIDLAMRCFGRTLDWFEAPDLMRYRAGGFYTSHADSENMDPKTRLWTKVIDRDLSLLIYLNEDFEGGELSFYKLNYRIRPRAGAAVLFPSDHRFLHQAEKVTKGVRYAVVSWASVKGVRKIAAKPPEPAIPVG